MPGGKIAEIRARDWEKHGENQILASFGQNHLKFNVHYIISWLPAAEAEKLAEKQFPSPFPLTLSLSLSPFLSLCLSCYTSPTISFTPSMSFTPKHSLHTSFYLSHILTHTFPRILCFFIHLSRQFFRLSLFLFLFAIHCVLFPSNLKIL